MPETQSPPDPSVVRSVVRVRVRFGETDLMRIAHHASYVTYMEVARVEWLRRRGVMYASWAERGLCLAVVDLSITYQAPARFDDELDVETSIFDLRSASLRFRYRIVRVGDETLCAQGVTRLACVNDSGRPRRLSAEMVEALARPEGG